MFVFFPMFLDLETNGRMWKWKEIICPVEDVRRDGCETEIGMAAERLSRRRRSLCHDGVCRDEDVIHGVLAQADGYPIACVSVV